MPRRLTIENVNSRIKDRNITLIGEYINGFITEATQMKFDNVVQLTENYITERGYNV